MGPKIDPWGIPHVSGAEDDVNSPMETEKLLLVRQDLNQFKTTPCIPTNHSSLAIKEFCDLWGQMPQWDSIYNGKDASWIFPNWQT